CYRLLVTRRGSERRVFFFSSRRRHTRCYRDWSSDVCSSDLAKDGAGQHEEELLRGEPEHQAHGEDAHERLPHLRHEVAYEPEREIGRASCREREEGWEVAVRVKRKELEV